MGQSSLLGIDRAPAIPAGRDTDALGPSDTSDSGSDLAGAETLHDSDAMVPVDVALADDQPNPDVGLGSRGGDSDSGGTGERMGVGGETLVDGADIGFDRVVQRADGDGEDAMGPIDLDLAEDTSVDSASDAGDSGD